MTSNTHAVGFYTIQIIGTLKQVTNKISFTLTVTALSTNSAPILQGLASTTETFYLVDLQEGLSLGPVYDVESDTVTATATAQSGGTYFTFDSATGTLMLNKASLLKLQSTSEVTYNIKIFLQDDNPTSSANTTYIVSIKIPATNTTNATSVATNISHSNSTKSN